MTEENIYLEENNQTEKEGEDETQIGRFKKLKNKLKKCQQEKQEYLDGWQRAKADLINYRRRQEEQMKEWQKLINQGLICELLPVLDSLEAGISNYELRITNNKEKDSDLENIKKQLWEILKKHGLEEIKSLGQKFNPEFHETVESVESDKEEGTIVEEVQKGYTLNGKVIRVAKVKVTKIIYAKNNRN